MYNSIILKKLIIEGIPENEMTGSFYVHSCDRACNQKIPGYFLILVISHKTKATIKTTTIIPAHIPALKIPPIAWQPASKEETNKKSVAKIVLLFIILFNS